MHWAWLDEEVRAKLVAAYVSGQDRDGSLKTKKWHAAMAEARMKLKEIEKYGTE